MGIARMSGLSRARPVPAMDRSWAIVSILCTVAGACTIMTLLQGQDRSDISIDQQLESASRHEVGVRKPEVVVRRETESLLAEPDGFTQMGQLKQQLPQYIPLSPVTKRRLWGADSVYARGNSDMPLQFPRDAEGTASEDG